MRRKEVCVFLASLVGAAMMITSCGPTSTTTTSQPTGTTTPRTTTSATTPATTTTAADLPQYGGVMVNVTTADPAGFDPGVRNNILTSSIYYTHEKLLQGDWSKGPAGTGETAWLNYLGNNFNLLSGSLAESWEMPNAETIIWHLRHGVRFWNRPPVNGREFTAEDAVWNIKREWESTYPTFNRTTWPAGTGPSSVTAVDKYTVKMTVAAKAQGLNILASGAQIYFLAPEIVKQYGHSDDWRTMVATGPFMLTDFVSGSSLTFQRNPTYWDTDPVGPGKGNQLPYVDSIKRLIISDLSTRLAAFRTAKIDYLQALTIDDYDELNRQIPKLERKQLYGTVRMLLGRMDKPELPFKDLRVRQALNLAIDKQDILTSYYKGKGEILSWPWYSWKEHDKAYVPLTSLPADVQELFTYNPQKAKQLLADAGYPNGFKTNIVTTADQVDLLSICRQYLLKVGIDMEIKPLEIGVFNSVNRGRTQEQMLFKETKMFFTPWMMHEVRTESFDDVSFFEAPETRAAYEELQPFVGKDSDKAWRILKDITPFMLQQAPMGGMLPVPHAFDMWWPWLKNFHAATRMSYWAPETNLKYAWIDKRVRTSMGY